MRKGALIVVFMTAGLGPGGNSAWAQDTASTTIADGSHVRVYAAGLGSRAVEGTARGFQDGLLVLDVGSGQAPIHIDLAAASRIERRVRESTRAKSALRGAAIGALTFVVVVAATDGCGGGDFIMTTEACYGLAGLFGGGAGSLVGLAVSHGERWEPVRLSHGTDRSLINAPQFRWQFALQF